MSLQDLSRSQDFTNQMQMDDNTRRSMGMMLFGNPEARTFIQNSGNVDTALSHIDSGATDGVSAGAASGNVAHPSGFGDRYSAPFGVSPQGAMQPTGVAGSPDAIDHAGNTMARISNQTPAPVVDFGAQRTNAAVAGLPPTGPSPAAAPLAPPRTAEEYAQQNPSMVSIPARPRVDLDSMSPGRRALFLAFSGLGKFGDSLAGNHNSVLDQFIGRTLEQRDAQRQYDLNLPAVTAKAKNDAFDQYLRQQQGISSIGHTNAETRQLNSTMSPAQQQMNERRREFYQKAVQAWQTDPQWKGNPIGFKQAMDFMGEGLGVEPGFYESLMNMPQFGNKYKVNEQNGVPVGLIDQRTNHLIGPGDIAGLKDNDAVALWNQAQAGYGEMRRAKQQDAATSAQRFMFRPIAVTDPQTGLKTWKLGWDAVGSGEGSAGVDEGTSKARSQWALTNDVFDTANQLHDSLPQRPLTTDEIAKISAAIKEYHGPVADAIKSNYLAGMKPDAAKLAANMLSMRDNIVATISAMHLQASDQRVQALWNALPAPGDFKNPALANQKMSNVYRMIINLSKGNVGSADTFGIENPVQPRMNPTGGGNQKVKRLKPDGKTYEYSKDGGKTWSPNP